MNLSNELRVAIDRALTSQKTEPRYRVFKDGNLNYQACANIARRWTADAGKPQDQLRDIAGSGSVLAVNDIASWNDRIRQCLTDDLRLLPSSVSGRGIETTDVYAFVSTTAGWTAFGAHVDFEHSIILDLDGAGRDVITWPEGGQYGQRMNEAKAFFGISFDWPSYSGDSTTSRIHPGEFAVIRARQPHVFHANGAGMFLGLSTEGTNESNVGSSVSDLASGAAFAPRYDSCLLQSVLNDAVPPPVKLVASPALDPSSNGLRLQKNSVALSAEERDLVTLNTIAGVVASYGTGSDPVGRAVTAKLVMIGAAIVHQHSRN